jgi:hypothetical protein
MTDKRKNIRLSVFLETIFGSYRGLEREILLNNKNLYKSKIRTFTGVEEWFISCRMRGKNHWVRFVPDLHKLVVKYVVDPL